MKQLPLLILTFITLSVISCKNQKDWYPDYEALDKAAKSCNCDSIEKAVIKRYNMAQKYFDEGIREFDMAQNYWQWAFRVMDKNKKQYDSLMKLNFIHDNKHDSLMILYNQEKANP